MVSVFVLDCLYFVLVLLHGGDMLNELPPLIFEYTGHTNVLRFVPDLHNAVQMGIIPLFAFVGLALIQF